MAYTTPLNIWERLGNEKIVDEEQPADTVSQGETLELANDKLIEQAYPGVEQDVLFQIDGTEVDTGDYTVDLLNGEIDYTGTGSGVPTVSYKYGTVPNRVIKNHIEDAEEYIDDIADTTFDGLNVVIDEYYDGQGKTNVLYTFDKQPVQSILTIEYNSAGDNEAPTYTEMTEGLANDFIPHTDLGVKFINSDKYPKKRHREVRVSYEYGYEDVPEQIRNFVEMVAIKNLFKDRVHGAGQDGRDNFDPQTVNSYNQEIESIKERWQRDRYDNFTTLAEEGLIG